MNHQQPMAHVWTRRRVLRGSAQAAAWLAAARWARADEPQPAPERDLLATSGDLDHEPAWAERLTIRVGNGGDVVGHDDKALQAAVNHVARLGGGTVEVLPGRYTLRNAVHLASRVRLRGHGDETILQKAPEVHSELAANSDWYDQEITLAQPDGFQVGDGVCLRAKNPFTTGEEVVKRTLVARNGNRFKLDQPLRENFWIKRPHVPDDQRCAHAATLFPLVTGEGIERFAVENLLLDGNLAHNSLLNGNYAGCIFLQDCQRARLHRVTARNYNGDGISWQICHDVHVTQCHSHDHAGLGLHPGSGSQRPHMLENLIENCQIGIFFCWGVRHGLAEGNQIHGVREAGISLGHNDTDNVVVKNKIVGSGQVGLLFRDEQELAFSPHRNRAQQNEIIDSGGDQGAAIDVCGQADGLVLTDNTLRETRARAERVAVRIAATVGGNLVIDNNYCEGFHQNLVDQRATAQAAGS